jgi:hypothetical protein
VWSPGVVMNTPPLRQHPDLLQRVEDFTVQEVVPQLPVETLAVAVLPGASRLDISRPRPRSGAQTSGDELRAVVGAEMLRHTFGHHNVGQRLDHLRRTPSAFRPDHLSSSTEESPRSIA